MIRGVIRCCIRSINLAIDQGNDSNSGEKSPPGEIPNSTKIIHYGES